MPCLLLCSSNLYNLFILERVGKKPGPVIIEPSLKRSDFIEYMRFYNFCLKAPQLSIKYQN